MVFSLMNFQPCTTFFLQAEQLSHGSFLSYEKRDDVKIMELDQPFLKFC